MRSPVCAHLPTRAPRRPQFALATSCRVPRRLAPPPRLPGITFICSPNHCRLIAITTCNLLQGPGKSSPPAASLPTNPPDILPRLPAAMSAEAPVKDGNEVTFDGANASTLPHSSKPSQPSMRRSSKKLTIVIKLGQCPSASAPTAVVVPTSHAQALTV